MPDISVIVPHLNQPDLLHKLLVSLHAQSFDIGRAEILVVDNGSDMRPDAAIAGFPAVRLAHEAEPGPGPARNRGVALSRAPLLAFTDSDCIADANWLATIVAHFAGAGDGDVIGGEIRMTVETPGAPSPAEAYECVYAYNQRRYIARDGYSVTANLAMRRAVFEAVGPFAGLETSEDLDWGRRARASGYRTVFVPEMIIHHPARRDMAALRAKWRRHTVHHFELRAGGAGGRAKWAATSVAMALSPLAELPRLLRTEKLDSPRARWQAFRGLTGVRLFRAGQMLRLLADPRHRTGALGWNRSSR